MPGGSSGEILFGAWLFESSFERVPVRSADSAGSVIQIDFECRTDFDVDVNGGGVTVWFALRRPSSTT